MLKKKAKFIIALGIILFLGYNSVYFKSLQEVQAAASDGQFDAAGFTQAFWNEKLMPATEEAIDLGQLMASLQTAKEQTFEKHSHAIGIGNIRYFLVKGKGKISAINENETILSLLSSTEASQLRISTEFVYGNAVRDAPGILKINDFESTMDLNRISEEINKKIRNEVIPPFRQQAKEGDTVTFTGAIELNEKYLNLEDIEVIPLVLNIEE